MTIKVERKQFPIVCVEALTTHKSQGRTYISVAVHPSRGMERSALYVACSRTTKASGLYIVGTFKPPLNVKDDKDVKQEIEYIKEERPLIPKYHFLTTCSENL